MPDKNCRNPSREAKNQWDLLKDNFDHWLGKRTGQRCEEVLPCIQKKLASISHFQDYRIIPRTFIDASVVPMSYTFSKKSQFFKQITSKGKLIIFFL